MILTRYFVLFIIYSLMGWIYESAYCTIKDHGWQNRGFLYGPIVPIYGFGALGVTILFHDIPVATFQNASELKVFLICYFGSIVLEYTTSFTLEKLFHAKWWDYSNVPININGRVCLPASIAFGVAGVIINKYVIPVIIGLDLFKHSLIIELMALFFMMLLGMDLALTVSALTSFSKEFERLNNSFNAYMTEKYDSTCESINDKKVAVITKTIASKEAAFVKRDIAAEKLNEIKEQFMEEYISNVIKNMPEIQRGQFRHIVKFSHPARGTKKYMEKAALYIKNTRTK